MTWIKTHFVAKWKIFGHSSVSGDPIMEYNELTKRLLAEGYTADHHPDYVQVDTSRLPGNDPLNNLSGGFKYKRFYRDSIVLYIKSRHHCNGLYTGIRH